MTKGWNGCEMMGCLLQFFCCRVSDQLNRAQASCCCKSLLGGGGFRTLGPLAMYPVTQPPRLHLGSGPLHSIGAHFKKSQSRHPNHSGTPVHRKIIQTL